MDPKLPGYPSQFNPGPPAQFPPEIAGMQSMGGFGAPRGAFPGGMMLRPGMGRAPGMTNQLRLPPNQLRLQLQQRLQGPQQVGWAGQGKAGTSGVAGFCSNTALTHTLNKTRCMHSLSSKWIC